MTYELIEQTTSSTFMFNPTFQHTTNLQQTNYGKNLYMKVQYSLRSPFELTIKVDCVVINLFQYTDMFCHLCSRLLLNKMWQIKKLLKMTNISICHNIFNYVLILIFSFIVSFHVFASMVIKSSPSDVLFEGLSHI